MSGQLSRVVVTCRTTRIVLAKGGTSGGSGVTSVTGTAPIVSSGGTTPAISITPATGSVAGSLSAADKTKLDALGSAAYLASSAFDASGTATAAIAAHNAEFKHANLPTDGEKTNIGNLDTAAYEPVASFDAAGAASGAVSSHESSYDHANLPTDDEKTRIAANHFRVTLGDGVTPLVAGSFIAIPLDATDAMTIASWKINANASGAAVVDIWVKAGAIPEVADSIIGGGGNKPTLAAAQIASAAVSGWASAVLASGSYLVVNIDSVDGALTQLVVDLIGA